MHRERMFQKRSWTSKTMCISPKRALARLVVPGAMSGRSCECSACLRRPDPRRRQARRDGTLTVGMIWLQHMPWHNDCAHAAFAATCAFLSVTCSGGRQSVTSAFQCPRPCLLLYFKFRLASACTGCASSAALRHALLLLPLWLLPCCCGLTCQCMRACCARAGCVFLRNLRGLLSTVPGSLCRSCC